MDFIKWHSVEGQKGFLHLTEAGKVHHFIWSRFSNSFLTFSISIRPYEWWEREQGKLLCFYIWSILTIPSVLSFILPWFIFLWKHSAVTSQTKYKLSVSVYLTVVSWTTCYDSLPVHDIDLELELAGRRGEGECLQNFTEKLSSLIEWSVHLTRSGRQS